MHGIARLRLVGTSPVGGETADGIEECQQDDFPQPLPFPTCVRSLPRRSCGNAAEAALDRVTLSFERLRDALGEGQQDRHVSGRGRQDRHVDGDLPGARPDDHGPRAA